jgi:hypothetical protein
LEGSGCPLEVGGLSLFRGSFEVEGLLTRWEGFLGSGGRALSEN